MFWRIHLKVVHVKSSCDQSYLDFARLQCVVECQSPYHIHILVANVFLHEVVEICDLLHLHLLFIVLSVYDKQHMLCSMNVAILKQWRVYRILDGSLKTLFALAVARVHDSHSTVSHRRADILEIHVDMSMHSYYLRNALNRAEQHVIGFGESV